MLHLPWPQTKIEKHNLIPVFIPFAGCKQRCIFCAQHLQSGTEQDTPTALATIEKILIHRQNAGKEAAELGFFGGTFTAFAKEDLELCLRFVAKQKKLGRITSARCSTRPDAIHKHMLQSLHHAGFTTIELGIQSFNNAALQAAQRQYTEEIALVACTKILEQGFTLGVQLMPGMPKADTHVFLDDVHKALHLGAHFLRFYPCQVIAGTELANLWKKGMYTPLTLDETIEALSKAWLTAHLQHVPTIRMGLAPENGLDKHILAGPQHPCLGNRVQANALYTYISTYTLQQKIQIQSLHVPSTCQGFFWGHKQELLPKWHNIGVHTKALHWHNEPYIQIQAS